MNLEYHHSKTIQLKSHDLKDLLKAKNLLEQGGLVALPTETVYGLAANGLSSAAISKVFKAKKRPANNPLILHTDSLEKAFNLFDFSRTSLKTRERFYKLGAKFWPGPLTIIAPKSAEVPPLATANLEHVAVRIPDHEATHNILSWLDFPLVMPSANLSTRPSPTTAAHVLKTLDGRIDAVVDGGPCLVGIESTVVKIDEDTVQILRPGFIDQQQLELCLNEEVVAKVHSEKAPLCPGQSYLHYSPQVLKVRLYTDDIIDERWATDDVIIAQTKDYVAKESLLGQRPRGSISIMLSDDPKGFAKELYSALYDAENSPDKQLSILKPRDHQKLGAVLDRIERAAS